MPGADSVPFNPYSQLEAIRQRKELSVNKFLKEELHIAASSYEILRRASRHPIRSVDGVSRLKPHTREKIYEYIRKNVGESNRVAEVLPAATANPDCCSVESLRYFATLIPSVQKIIVGAADAFGHETVTRQHMEAVANAYRS